ncbi:uncharacterized protein K444DRAFT_626831 [Hyaloscypha bicolor E]|uniref:Uncharacterized protein n=1 Tax=Hyaloscypha bicolor E TaxID=1095630 RepID=A0A2J6TJ95_9HELO|nr:uncharacterized protein K444DRAFT_626831 [Hyaloscypha bicolor E]PMD63082.1 hypothetical protein K444DRAFT_626831 [Hyaloscypha bicolor E]
MSGYGSHGSGSGGSRYRAGYDSNSDDNHTGPYYRDVNFYAASRPSRSTSRTSSSDRPHYDYESDEPRGRSCTPSPPPRPGCSTYTSSYTGSYRSNARSPFSSTANRGYRTSSPPPTRAPSPPRQSQSSYSSYSSYSSSSRSAPPPQSSSSARQNSPAPYTYGDEEPDRIPHDPGAWNNYSTTSTREQLISYFVSRGYDRVTAEREVGKEFEAHAPQHRSGLGPGPSRFQEAGGSRNGGGSGSGRGRDPGPDNFSGYRGQGGRDDGIRFDQTYGGPRFGVPPMPGDYRGW